LIPALLEECMISSETQRILYIESTGSDLVDASDDLNNFRDGSVTLALESTGFIYIGQYLPFVSRFFDLETFNASPASLEIDYWSGSEWKNTVDRRDRTVVTGNTLGRSGYLHWRLNRYDTNWTNQCDSNNVSGLESGPQIFDYYWLRIRPTADIDSLTINHIGNLFSTDGEMYSFYPALDNQVTRDQWKRAAPGTKTGWLEQGLMSAEFIIRDLKTRNIILEDGQIFDVSKFNLCSIHKQANIIYTGLGRGFKDQQDATQTAYEDAMKLERLNIDKAADGVLRGRERLIRTGFANR